MTQGRLLIEMAEKGFLPHFDRFFDTPGIETRRVTFTPVEAIDFWEKFSTAYKLN